MKVEVNFGAIAKTKPRDWLIRFLFGGGVSVATGLIAHAWGPFVGGLFLAFPAILPATLTLAKERSGREQANEDARGGVLGAIGLVAFAGIVAWLAPLLPAAAVLVLALAIWSVSALALWWSVFG